MREEACVDVLDATLLGYTRGTPEGGTEDGLVLVRSHWLANVRVEPWRPEHEIAHRTLVPADEWRERIAMGTGFEPLFDVVFAAARL